MTTFAATLPLIAALVALGGALVVSWRQISDQRAARAEQRRDDLNLERRRAYVDLLSGGRRLRDIPLRHFQGSPQDVDPDPIIADTYRALYSIKITAPPAIANLAQDFFDAAIRFWRLSRDEPDASSERWHAEKDEVQRRVQAFRRALRKEFGELSGEEMGELNYA